ncbi:MAG: cytochrome c family protein, partial [Armatimonadetes bacterium]|nr:cytochrome c family protein [Armatimonadota bacterium]
AIESAITQLELGAGAQRVRVVRLQRARVVSPRARLPRVLVAHADGDERLLQRLAAAVAVGIVLGWVPPVKTATTVLASGDTRGFLAPCGCVKPMKGGIQRKGTVVRSFSKESTLYLELGPLVGERGRQSELKADALAEMLKSLEASAFGLTGADASLSVDALTQVQRLSGNRLVATQLNSTFSVPFRSDRGWMIGAISLDPKFGAAWGLKASTPQQAWADLNKASKGLPIAVLLDGDQSEAKTFAKTHLAARIVVYRGATAGAVRAQSGAWLVGSGERGKSVVSVDLRKSGTSKVIELGPEHRDDPVIKQIEERYLGRVGSENLLKQVARTTGPEFSGSAACISCHSTEGEAWRKSEHSHALLTLEQVKHDKDPECVGCHVVGLTKKVGFRSRAESPELANVGCESCHGAGQAHSQKPLEFKLGKTPERLCITCHNPEHSPNFDAIKAWAKVKH